MIFRLTGTELPKVSIVGGKGRALIETSQAGFPVPEGLVLSVDFFNEWLIRIKGSKHWEKVLEKTDKAHCELLVDMAKKLKFNEKMLRCFEEEVSLLDDNLFAVRSSSPEEDLEGTSYAGMYESILGQRKDQLETAVAHVFSSCFDYRVMAYKKEKGLDIEKTSIAVVVQKQIASEISGVAFSLNPLNNAFDEVYINASFGLGESIVSGIVTPDSYIVDDVEQKIIDKKIGDKKISLWLNKQGGIDQKTQDNKDKQTLDDKQIIALAQMVKKCEAYYKMPIDVEWAIEKGKLFLLQSRPITTYFPFFKDLLTEPGKNKRFYIDLMALTQGFDDPMSVLGLELWANMLIEVKMHMMTPPANGSTPAIYGKEYFSLTAFQKVVGKKNAIKFVSSYDKNIKNIFEQIDIFEHPFEGRVEGTEKARSTMFKSVFKMLPGIFIGLFGNYEKGIEKYLETSNKIINKTNMLSSQDDFAKMSGNALAYMTQAMSTAPVIFSGMVAKNTMASIFKGEDVENELSAMNMDLDGNPTSEMGHLMYQMACETSFNQVSSRESFIENIRNRTFEQSFLNLFDEFMSKYSARGFNEIDVASKRLPEDLGILYDKLIEINVVDNQIIKVKEKRKLAYEKLLVVAKKKGKERKFVKAAEKMKATFGYREHPKYLIVLIMAKLHDICLEIAEEFVRDGRIENKYDIFDLKADEIDQARKNISFDINAARQKNLSGYVSCKDWPLVIDSRGKIYKPKLEVMDGDYIGDPVAPGKVTGKAKVLRTPYEKPLDSGEILIAKFTEPSWTPIFTNASGVVMEVGGPLQHGGIIAREYGIPCVSGLMGIMDIIKDGDLIEVDGFNGLVKIIQSA